MEDEPGPFLIDFLIGEVNSLQLDHEQVWVGLASTSLDRLMPRPIKY